MGGISNFQIENAIQNIRDNDLIDNFVGVFFSNYMIKFIDYASMISDKGKYPFIIANTDNSEKPGVHWWSILDIEPKTDIFYLILLVLDGLNHFIVQDDKPIVEKILFNLGACKAPSEEVIDSLSDTARNFFRFVQAFGIKLKLRNVVNIWMLEDRLQDLDSSTCGIFQLYFYNNLFSPNENSNIQNDTKLTKRTVETLLNELSTLDDQDTNEQKMEKYADEIGVTIN